MNSNVKNSDRIPLASLTAMLLACAFVVSTAYADDQVRTETVKFQDLNVHTRAGAESLYGRIHAAAKQVCSETDRMQQARAAACARKAEAQAIQELNLPQLTAYYQLKIGGPTQTRTANR
jgi:UrcA family protein